MDSEHGSENSKHSDIVVDRSRESKQSDEQSKVSDGSGESKISETLEKVRDGSGGSPQSSSDCVQPPLSSQVLDAIDDNEGHLRVPSEKLISLASTSSSASDISLEDNEDLFMVDTSRIPTSANLPPLPGNYDQSSPQPSTSRLSSVTNGSPTEYPALQMMDRQGGYDPSRIPSAVFERSKSSEEIEWSVASNESLFSLHLGNNSFSRDHILMLSDFSQPELTKSGELFGLSSPASAQILETGINRIEEGRESADDENIKDSECTSAEDHRKGIVPPQTRSLKSPSLALSLRSDGSGASIHSFAFPILTEGVRNSSKFTQCFEEQRQEPPPAAAAISVPKKPSKRKLTYWLPRFSWCKGGCGCSCRRLCSCPSCSCPTCSFC